MEGDGGILHGSHGNLRKWWNIGKQILHPHMRKKQINNFQKKMDKVLERVEVSPKKGKHNWSDRQIGQVAAAPTPEDLDRLHQLKISSPSLGVSPKLISLKATDWVINEMGKMFSNPGGHWNWSNSLVTVSSNCKRSLDKLVSVAEITLAYQIVSSNFAPFIYLVGTLNCRSNSNRFKNCFR